MGGKNLGKTSAKKKVVDYFKTPTNTELRQGIFLTLLFPLYFVFTFQILQNGNNTFLFGQMYSYKATY